MTIFVKSFLKSFLVLSFFALLSLSFLVFSYAVEQVGDSYYFIIDDVDRSASFWNNEPNSLPPPDEYHANVSYGWDSSDNFCSANWSFYTYSDSTLYVGYCYPYTGVVVINYPFEAGATYSFDLTSYIDFQNGTVHGIDPYYRVDFLSPTGENLGNILVSDEEYLSVPRTNNVTFVPSENFDSITLNFTSSNLSQVQKNGPFDESVFYSVRVCLQSLVMTYTPAPEMTVIDYLKDIWAVVTGKGDTDYTDPGLSGQITESGELMDSIDEVEQEIQGSFTSNLEQIPLDTQFSTGVLAGMSFVGSMFTSYFNVMGDLQLVILFPLLIGLCLLLIGRGGAAIKSISGRRDKKGKGD